MNLVAFYVGFGIRWVLTSLPISIVGVPSRAYNSWKESIQDHSSFFDK